MERKEVLQNVLEDLLVIFKNNIDQQGYASVHGVYEDLKKYMHVLKSEIENES